MKKAFFTTFFLLSIGQVFACLILFITDGHTVLVANHEDWYARDAEVSFVPATKNTFGMLYFDFASEKTAQGGMNTEGLFFDGTRTPFAPYNINSSKEDCHCYIWKKILGECANVEEAIRYVQRYKIQEMEEVHILFADRSGHSAVLGVYDGQLQVHRRVGNHQLLTNFNLSNPSYGDEPPCRRFETAEQMLTRDSAVTVANLESILSKTHQDSLTVYSNVYDLGRGEVYVYNRANFKKRVKLNLADALKKGSHSISIDRLFR